MWCGKGEKTNTFDDAKKRFLVQAGIGRDLDAPASRPRERS
jgi:hypothetical protein